ncbi:hypothetical protein CIPAW_15G098600 [Carya illinoinensis]|uniref:Uncharacterized protein n=1 Tax=Carya illinoinensis TaxID=32201 RepID=A0A8T1NDY3_CARIL|nr:hypothetical protein CIPAW_15G098600 [Carya illinoinensis]
MNCHILGIELPLEFTLELFPRINGASTLLYLTMLTTPPSTSKISKIEGSSTYLDTLVLHVQSFKVALHVPHVVVKFFGIPLAIELFWFGGIHPWCRHHPSSDDAPIGHCTLAYSPIRLGLL